MATFIETMVQRNILMGRQMLLRTSVSTVDNDQDEHEDQDKEDTANEGNEPGLGGELIQAQVTVGVGQDHVDHVVGVHGELQPGGEGTMADIGKCCCSDHIGLIQSQVH